MISTPIVPVAVYPGEANTLAIRSTAFGPPPSYYFQLQRVTVTPGKPAKTDLVTGEVIVPEIPDETTVVVLKDGNVNMKEEQWQAWPADLGVDGDNEYQLDSIAANLGLTRE